MYKFAPQGLVHHSSLKNIMTATTLKPENDSKDGWSPSMYSKHVSFVFADSTIESVLQLLSPQKGDYIMDMGCGSGEITIQLQDSVGETGIVVGVDLSQNMVWVNAFIVRFLTLKLFLSL
jgi:SAM-dependent methyltransferase